MEGFAPQTLLRPSRCPVCGRPAAELAPCPWCGERAPAARATRTDAALLLLAWAAAVPTSVLASPFFASFLAGFLLLFRARGHAVAISAIAEPPGQAARRGVRFALPALTAATVALLAGRFPVSAAELRPTAGLLLPILAAALCLGRAPAEPPVPSESARERLLAREAPGLVLLSLTLPPLLFTNAPVTSGAIFGVLCARLVRPGPWLVFAAPALAAAGPDPSALALGTVLGTVALFFP